MFNYTFCLLQKLTLTFLYQLSTWYKVGFYPQLNLFKQISVFVVIDYYNFIVLTYHVV